MRILEDHATPDGEGRVVRLAIEPTVPFGAVEVIPARMPAACARCLGRATTHARAVGVGNATSFLPRRKRRLAIDVPYCEPCRRKDAREGRRAALVLLAVVLPLTGLALWGTAAAASGWSILLLALAVLGLGAILAGLGILANPLRTGGAVWIVVPDTDGPILLQLRCEAYGRRFVEANGGVTPDDAAPAS